MDRPNNLTMHRLRYMVIDEADEMLHGGWEEDLSKIMGAVVAHKKKKICLPPEEGRRPNFLFFPAKVVLAV